MTSHNDDTNSAESSTGDGNPPPPDSSPTSDQLPPAPPRRLYRDPSGPLAGVATGYARYFNVDPTIVKIIFVALAILGGSGLFIYLASIFLLPTVDSQGQLRNPSNSSVVVGFAIGIVILLGAVSAAGFGASGGGALLLIVIGAYLLSQRPYETSQMASQVASYSEPALRFDSNGGSGEMPPPPQQHWGTVPSQPAPTPKPAGPPVTIITLALAAVVAGVLIGLDQIDGITITAVGVWGSIAATCGAGLIYSAWRGRGAWLLLFPAMFALTGMGIAQVAASHPDLDWNLTIGSSDHIITDQAQLASSYELHTGKIELDLTDLELDTSTSVDLAVTAGSIKVQVPKGMAVNINCAVDIGELTVFGNFQEGDNLTSRSTTTGSELQPVLTINAHTNFGEVIIEHG